MKGKALLLLLIFSLFGVEFASGQEPPMFEVVILPVSSSLFDDIAPVITGDGIIFCSNRKSKVVSDYNTFDGLRVWDVYFAEKRDSTKWRKPGIWSDDLTTPLSEGPLCFSPDGNKVYFTRDIVTGKQAKKKKTQNKLGIFTAIKSGGKWTDIKPFEYNTTDYHVAHPSISTDGKYLFFSSDMPGGQGGADIYYCERTANGWGKPVNAGPLVNTPSSELYPFFHSSGRLYFSSDRQGGKGGLDVYFTLLQYGSWMKPSPMPEPINSPSDDFAVAIEKDGQSGYFTSNRRRNDDIYRFSSTVIRKLNCSEAVVDSYCYEFVEENAVKLDSTPFLYEWDFGDGKKARGITAEHCFENPGDYLVKLNAVNLITGEVKYNEVTYFLEIRKTEQAVFTAAESAKAGDQVTFDSSPTNLPGWNITRYYWNFDDGTSSTGATTEKSFAIPGNYNVQLIVSGAPDENGAVREACVSKKIVIVGPDQGK